MEKKFFYSSEQALLDWIHDGVSTANTSVECQIMDVADDIAYAVHDLEDGVHAGMITEQKATALGNRVLNEARRRNPKVDEDDVIWALTQIRRMAPTFASSDDRRRKAARKTTASELIGEAIRATTLKRRIPSITSARYEVEVRFAPQWRSRIDVLKVLSYQLLIDDARVQTLEARAERILTDLFNFFATKRAARAYPDDFRDRFDKAATDEERERVACDFISGMTDQYAERMYQRLFTASRAALNDY